MMKNKMKRKVRKKEDLQFLKKYSNLFKKILMMIKIKNNKKKRYFKAHQIKKLLTLKILVQNLQMLFFKSIKI